MRSGLIDLGQEQRKSAGKMVVRSYALGLMDLEPAREQLLRLFPGESVDELDDLLDGARAIAESRYR